MSYPTAIPSYTDTNGSEVLGTAGGGVGLSAILDVYGVDITGVATKIGTGSSTPTAGKVLRASGTGTSVWGAVDVTADITGILPIANGGTGQVNLTSLSLTTPTLTSPTITNPTITVDTIAEYTAANGVTIDSLNIKDGKLNTNDSVVTNNITDDAVTAPKLVGIDRSNLTTDSNPYKFSVYRNAVWTAGNNAFAKVVFDTEIFDTNSNFASGTYTVPVDGYYQLNACVSINTVTGAGTSASLFKNGSLFMAGRSGVEGSGYTGGYQTSSPISVFVYLSAGNTMDIYSYSNNQAGGTGSAYTYFNGFLVSRT